MQVSNSPKDKPEPSPPEPDLLVRCARMFYEQKLTKAQVAAALHLSAMRVTRLICKAEKLGIVQIRVTAHPRCEELEQALAGKYGLRRVAVVEYTDDYEALRKSLGAKAAGVFDDEVSRRENTRVGIGGGGSIYDMVDHLPTKSRCISIYPLAAFGRGPEITFFDSGYLTTLLLLKSRPTARAFTVSVPPLPRDPAKAAVFSQTLCSDIPEINEVLDCSRNVDVAVISLGTNLEFDDAVKKLGGAGPLGRALRSNSIVGGINYNYFNDQGQEIENYILKVSIEDLKDLSKKAGKTVILLAGGRHKSKAIGIALKFRMANSLVTDSDTAEFLLKA